MIIENLDSIDQLPETKYTANIQPLKETAANWLLAAASSKVVKIRMLAARRLARFFYSASKKGRDGAYCRLIFDDDPGVKQAAIVSAQKLTDVVEIRRSLVEVASSKTFEQSNRIAATNLLVLSFRLREYDLRFEPGEPIRVELLNCLTALAVEYDEALSRLAIKHLLVLDWVEGLVWVIRNGNERQHRILLEEIDRLDPDDDYGSPTRSYLLALLTRKGASSDDRGVVSREISHSAIEAIPRHVRTTPVGQVVSNLYLSMSSTKEFQTCAAAYEKILVQVLSDGLAALWKAAKIESEPGNAAKIKLKKLFGFNVTSEADPALTDTAPYFPNEESIARACKRWLEGAMADRAMTREVDTSALPGKARERPADST